MQERMQWHYLFKLLKEKDLQPRTLYKVRFTFRIEEGIKVWYKKTKIKADFHQKMHARILKKCNITKEGVKTTFYNEGDRGRKYVIA